MEITWLQFKLLLIWWACFWSRSSGAEQQYGFEDQFAGDWETHTNRGYGAPPRGRAGPAMARQQGARGEGGGLMMGLVKLAMPLVAGVGISKLLNYKSWKAMTNKHREQCDAIFNQATLEKEAVMKKANDEITQLQYRCQEAQQYAQELTKKVNDQDSKNQLEQLEADYKEFTEPDLNADGFITRGEFNNYLNHYFKQFPEIPLSEYPSFDDFDVTRDGVIAFEEWRTYIHRLQQQQLAEQRQAQQMQQYMYMG